MQESTRLYKTDQGAVLGGVCKGISEVYGWDVSLVRLVFVLTTFFVVGSPIIIYLIMWLVIPNKSDVVNTRRSDGKKDLSDDFSINQDDYKY